MHENAVPVERLSSGYVIPVLGFGTQNLPDDVVSDAVYDAILHGFRFIDCGPAEHNVRAAGAGINKLLLDVKHKTDRKDLFISCTFQPEQVDQQIDSILRWLQLDYIDLLLCDIPSANHRYHPEYQLQVQNVWSHMEAAVRQGKVLSLGLLNSSATELEIVQDIARVPIAVHQVALESRESIELDVDAQELCRKTDTFTIYKTKDDVNVPRKMNNHFRELSGMTGRSLTQIYLRFLLQRDCGAVTTGTRNAQEMKQSISVFDFEISDHQMNAIIDCSST